MWQAFHFTRLVIYCVLYTLTGFRILDEGQREVTIDYSLASRFKVGGKKKGLGEVGLILT